MNNLIICTIYCSDDTYTDSNFITCTTYSSDDLYTEEDIKIMAGEKSPTTVHNPSTSSVAAFFANACEQEQKEQERSDQNVCANGSEFQPPSIKPPDSRHNVSTMHQHPPSGVVTGGPPGIGLTLQNTAAPMPGTYP